MSWGPFLLGWYSVLSSGNLGTGGWGTEPCPSSVTVREREEKFPERVPENRMLELKIFHVNLIQRSWLLFYTDNER